MSSWKNDVLPFELMELIEHARSHQAIMDGR